jgi:hypothetical protein
MKEKLSNGLTGIAGEYFVAAELSLRGFMASVTLRNNDSIDIHASKLDYKHKMFSIQVKTSQTKTRKWILNKKAEISNSDSHFYIFVLLKGKLERPDYFIIPSKTLANIVKEGHENWLNTPGKNGQTHKDTDIRQFDDKDGEYLERWDLLN